MNRSANIIFVFVCFLGLSKVSAQENLLDILNKERKDTTLLTMATFKNTRLSVAQSVETRKKGALQLYFGTRYWNIPMEEPRNSFLVDRFSAQFGFDYAFTDRFTTSFSVNTFDGVLNGFLKYRLLRQTDDNKVPFGITALQSTTLLTREYNGIRLPRMQSDRFFFTQQLIIARKFNRNLSLQVAPTYIHATWPQPTLGRTDFFALGLGGRYRIGKHTELTSEYHWVGNRDQGPEGYNSFAIGLNWEIGDVTMQMHMTNTKSFDEASSILLTPNNFNFEDGGLHIGVNAIFILHLKKQKLK
ncbi:DUF5777 family beta-barrel protein [Croceivirga sp. JEA036]|uniref:DUF5777 family beta-barrel protein n=1 Tax=Croceivirga sp. JEA036 TaxID=2721162 RepID=UPI00143A4576|nr:DUF5777 family beta-barrel protein [Croceivirga sp. JEA036]NJB35091.1 hypothetical protein [Croceivirga sp. JEA036]